MLAAGSLVSHQLCQPVQKGGGRTVLEGLTADWSLNEQHKEREGALSQSLSVCYQKGNLSLRPWFHLLPNKQLTVASHTLFMLIKHGLDMSTKGKETS